MTKIQERLEVDRKELLDLSMRNTLLNFRPLRSKGLIVEDELSDQVFRILVAKGSGMTFLPAPELAEGSTKKLPLRVGDQNLDVTKEGNVLWLFGQPSEEAENEEQGRDKPAARHIDKKLQTPHSDGRLQRRLLSSYYVARSSIEEHGVNTLFLALGFLRWFESDSSEEARKAPLILLPVKLDRPSAQAKFRLEYTDDDLGTNLSLREKLHRDFGVSLPEFKAVDDNGVNDYFAAVASAVSKLGRWEVDPNEIRLGFFSFTKLLMYKDLDSDSWPAGRKPADHPVLGALLGGGFTDSAPSHLPPEKLDERLSPDDSTHIWDADSSQTLALLEVAEGKNLVIQGPPGTGKSQTITNLVADAVASGKRVLFVAEKMAALEVVKRRLDRAHVGDLCLELHSYKSNKAALLEDLARTLRLGCPKLPDFDPELKELGVSLKSLNRYCTAVHRTIADSSTTPYQAFGALLRLRRELGEEELPVIDNQALRHWPRQVFLSRLAKLKTFKSALETIGVPSRHVFWGSKVAVFLPKDATEVAGLARAAREALIRCEEAAGGLAEELGLEHSSNLQEVDGTLDAASRVAGAPPLAGVAVNDTRWITQREGIETSVSQGSSLQGIRRSYSDLLLPESWDEDVLETRREYGRYADKWWRLLSGRYRAARRYFLGLFQKKPPKSNKERVELLDTLLEAQRLTRSLSEKQDVIRSLLGTNWRGFESDFSRLRAVTGFLVHLHEAVAESKTPAGLLDYLSVERDSAALRRRIDEVEHCRAELDTALDQTWKSTQFSEERRFGRTITQVPFSELATLFSAWVKEPETLREMTQFNTWTNELEKESLSELVTKCAVWVGASQHADHLFEKAWYDGLVEEALKERPELQTFDSNVHGKTLQRFRKLDRWLLERNRLRLAQRHWETLPRTGSGGQVAVLKREFGKKTRHKKIRQLLTEAGRAIQGIKPVFMMSPLSVAAYLPQEGVDFDLVVFDEASQVTPVDAYGALLRGKQAVVVGDSKQLPPTPFFNKISEDEEREEDQASDQESVLELFSSCNAPDAMLRWHYRSQHESLITVSNHEFYDNDLFVFPSPDQTRQDLGLVYRRVEGTFLRGKGRSYNPDEAKVVAEAVLRHARGQPHLSLGVAAFSKKQSQTIQDQVELLRRESPETESFFSGHPEEPFFVKNLENVQGDERDAIFISVGYGRDEDGLPSHNFGPLNQQRGERRLNVLITRAKMRCEVFTNLTADDIDLSKSNARGVKALKTFLQYARDGVLDVPEPTDLGPDSEFEVEVAHELRNLGYEIDGQVGSGGFFIDLAVKDPRAPGRYLLGIECDGATYHSSKWARDRDRLREEVLRRLKWKIHRIWSTDWFMNPEREVRRVQEAIEKAKTVSHHSSENLTPVSADVPTVLVRAEPELDLDMDPKAAPYVKATFRVTPHRRFKLYDQPPDKVVPWVQRVVEVEGPIHRDLVIVRIAECADLHAVHQRTREAVKRGIRMAAKRRLIEVRGDFLWKPDGEPALRDWTSLPPSQRKIEFTSPEEIGLALSRVVEGAISIKREEAVLRAGRLLGYLRISDQIHATIDSVIPALLQDDRLSVSADELTLPR